MMEIEHVRPADIEQTSFRIIEKEIREMGLELPEDKKHILLRVIHTTADFDYLDTMTFSKNAVEKAEDAFRRGAHVVTDTTMAMSGINKEDSLFSVDRLIVISRTRRSRRLPKGRNDGLRPL